MCQCLVVRDRENSVVGRCECADRPKVSRNFSVDSKVVCAEVRCLIPQFQCLQTKHIFPSFYATMRRKAKKRLYIHFVAGAVFKAPYFCSHVWKVFLRPFGVIVKL